MRHNRGSRGQPIDDPALDGREMGCRKCGGECVVDCWSCEGWGEIPGLTDEHASCPVCEGACELPCECQED